MRRKVFIFFLFALLLFTIFAGTQKITSFQYNPLAALIAGVFPSWQKNQPPISSEEIPGSSFIQEENINPEAGQDDDVLVEKIDDLEDQIDVLSQRINEMEKQLQFLSKQVSMAQEEKEDTEEEAQEDELVEEEVGQKVGQEPCERIQGVQPTKNKIIFNEIAWMGTSNSSSAEWMELKNISGKPLDLSGWQILDKEEQIKIFFSAEGAISAGGVFLLERKNDDVIPGIKADKIYTGTLSNENEALYLFDENCQLQDEVIAGSDWPAGDNSSKRTMERKSDFTWQTSLNPGGTPKAENSSGYVVVTPPTGRGGRGAPPPVVYPKILITEARISPINERFVELYNPNSEAVNLTDWYIQRKTESGNIESLVSSTRFEGKNINPLDYFLIVHSSSTLATDPDILLDTTLTKNNTLLLKNPNREIADEIGWQDISESFSYGRTWDDLVNNYSNNFEILDPTPKEKNKPKTNQSPIASFTFSPENPSIDEEINFDATSSTDPDGQIVNYIWDFGDDNSITIDQATTTHSYATSTDFTIGLQVIDNEGAVSALATSTIFVAETGEPFSELDVVINEIAWMGTKANSADEWIELYNNTNQEIDLTDWKIYEDGGTILITVLQNKIGPKSYYLIERTDDDSVFDITADIFGPFGGSGLSDNGEYIILKDNKDNTIDEVNASAGWFTVKKTDKPSMERINPKISGNLAGNWAENNGLTKKGLDAEGNPINGTPKAQNSAYQQP
jgi:hypothetical protein